MMGYQMFLVVMFLLGIGAEENPSEHCVEAASLEKIFDFITNLEESEESLDLYCGKLLSFMTCVNRVWKDDTGLDLKETADLFSETELGIALTMLINSQDICTEGTELRNDYLANAQCYHDMPNNIAQDCDEQAKAALSTFRELQEETDGTETDDDEPCVFAAYHFGCLGANIQKHCGDGGFETYKKLVKKTGIFNSAICSSELMNTIKTDFLDILEITEDQKTLYRVILNLKRRRR